MMTIRHALIHNLAVHNPQLLPHSPVDLRTEPDRRTSLRSGVSLSFSAAAFLDRHCLGTGAGLASAICDKRRLNSRGLEMTTQVYPIQR
jgi:hypothetical protein